MSESTGLISVSAPASPAGKLTVMERFATHAARSGMFKKLVNNNISAAVMVLKFGDDLGLSMTTSLTSIHFIDGKPVMSGNLLWSLVQADARWEDSVVEEHTDKKVVIAWKKDGKPRGRTTWSEEDAKRAGLLAKDNWKKYPRAMLFNRAVSEGFKLNCPHLSKGYTVYTPDELGADIDAQGEAVRVEVIPTPRALEPESASGEVSELRGEFQMLLVETKTDPAVVARNYDVDTVNDLDEECLRAAVSILRLKKQLAPVAAVTV